jgi:hypothetical protein
MRVDMGQAGAASSRVSADEHVRVETDGQRSGRRALDFRVHVTHAEVMVKCVERARTLRFSTSRME